MADHDHAHDERELLDLLRRFETAARAYISGRRPEESEKQHAEVDL
jgi:hypothetical protein